jgi:arginyl-tRNA synthetase
MHIGHTRWAALGDAIARVLLASGATLVREFYINDAGAQMDRFGRSVLAAIKGEPTPEDGYRARTSTTSPAACSPSCPASSICSTTSRW